MKVLVSGASGMVGRDLVAHLTAKGHKVTKLLRREVSQYRKERDSIQWNSLTEDNQTASFENFDAVIHLAGESIAQGRWTAAKKKRIHDSRTIPTRNLARILTQLANPPKVFISASAIGYYGDRGAEELRENSAPGQGFLPSVCQEWEQNTAVAAQKGIRVVNLRFGIILSTKGGALAKMLPPFKMGVGGKLGSGEQFMSWIALEDVVGVIEYALLNEDLAGPVNTVAPDPLSNSSFTKVLGRVLHRPTIFPVPAFGAKLAFGEMAEALLLSSARVIPEKLKRSGYRFRHPDLEEALTSILTSR